MERHKKSLKSGTRFSIPAAFKLKRDNRME